jgi:hypothetical protein
MDAQSKHVLCLQALIDYLSYEGTLAGHAGLGGPDLAVVVSGCDLSALPTLSAVTAPVLCELNVHWQSVQRQCLP